MVHDNVKRRDGYFDGLKFLLIVLVILGHTLEANLDNHTSLALYNTIYLFHMPLFIFVTGYFTKKSNDTKKQKLSIARLLETLIVFQLAHFVQNGCSGGVISLVLFPKWTMWYLYSVIAWKIFIYIMPEEILKNYKVVIISTILASLTVGFVQYDALSFHRTIVFSPFFMMGYYCRTYTVDFKKHLPSRKTSMFILLSVFIATFFLDVPFFEVVSGARSYCFYDSSALTSTTMRFAHLIIAFIMSSCIMRFAEDIKIDYISGIGSDTLFFYMVHSFIVLLTRDIMSKMGFEFSLQVLIVLFVLNFIIVYILSKIPYLHIILNPISKFLNRKI